MTEAVEPFTQLVRYEMNISQLNSGSSSATGGPPMSSRVIGVKPKDATPPE